MMRTRATMFFAFAALVAAGCSSPTSSGVILDGDAGADGGVSSDRGVVAVVDAPLTAGDTGPAVTPAYAACSAGQACAGGTTCAAASYTSNGLGANLCTTSCAIGAECPAFGSGSAYLPTCVVNGATGAGQCYDTCATNTECGAGTNCAVIPGTDNRICVPVGAGGPVTQPLPPAYSSCTPAGGTCQSGTTCVTSAFTRAGAAAGNLCTVACTSGNAAMCPGYVVGAAVQAVECVAPMGNPAAAQCLRLCNPANGNADCAPYFTQCAVIQMAAGPLNACVP
ncbi:MAG: hypothetical protein JWM10_1468 [Myxococcaceae bacterium]|nr:hypothetical protein [Myxococcaceae bacterium]